MVEQAHWTGQRNPRFVASVSLATETTSVIQKIASGSSTRQLLGDLSLDTCGLRKCSTQFHILRTSNICQFHHGFIIIAFVVDHHNSSSYLELLVASPPTSRRFTSGCYATAATSVPSSYITRSVHWRSQALCPQLRILVESLERSGECSQGSVVNLTAINDSMIESSRLFATTIKFVWSSFASYFALW